MSLLSYSAKDVLLKLGDTIIDGFADGSIVSIEFTENVWNTAVGARGDVVRSATNNNVAEITIRLMRNSPGNYVLGQMLAADEGATKGGAVKFYMKDSSTGIEHMGEQVWVQERPTHDQAMEHVPLEWVLAGKIRTVYPVTLNQNVMEPGF